jgi:hypothetical protein
MHLTLQRVVWPRSSSPLLTILYNIAKRIIARHGEDIFGLCKSDDGLGRRIYV